MPSAIFFALIGLFLGGFRGLIVGAVLGFVTGWVAQQVLRKKLTTIQAQFHESTFAVMGALCKADGVVTRDEIQTAEAMFERLHLTAAQRESAKTAFARGKAPGFDLDAEVAKLVAASRSYRPILSLFLQVQCAAIAADGDVHPAEHQMLVRVARLLGLTEADVAQLEAMLRTGARGPSPQQKLDDAYAALGLASSATDAEVKRAYRRLMSQNHPDKLAGKGLPDSMREMAEERTREISIAYATIKDSRGFN
jgi:DnaJ like chaperone protein